MHEKYDIIGLGVCVVDDLLYVDAWPARDAKVRIARRDRQCGGLTANALVAAVRLGARCAYAGVLGEDEASDWVRDRLSAEGIDLRHACVHPPAGPARSTIVVGQDVGSRNIFSDSSAATGHAARCPVPRDVVARARVLLVDHVDAERMLSAARLARAMGVAVVLDMERVNVPFARELLAIADHAILPAHAAMELTGCTTPAESACMLGQSADQTVVVTAGEAGCWAVDGPTTNRRPMHYPADQVNAVDTTGCGDVFHGAYAAMLAQGQNLQERIRWASAAAAMKATRHGGGSSAPTRAEVEAFMNQYPAELDG